MTTAAPELRGDRPVEADAGDDPESGRAARCAAARTERLLLAGGYAQVYPEHDLDDPAMAPVRRALRRLLTAHRPFPALVVDRHWNLVEANSAVTLFLAGAAADVLVQPMNVLGSRCIHG